MFAEKGNDNKNDRKDTVQKKSDPIGKSFPSSPIQAKSISTNTVVQRNPLARAATQIVKTGAQKFAPMAVPKMAPMAVPKVLPAAQIPKFIKPPVSGMASGGGGIKPPTMPFNFSSMPGGSPVAGNFFRSGGAGGGRGGFGGFAGGGSFNPNLIPFIIGAQKKIEEKEDDGSLLDYSTIIEDAINKMYSVKDAVSDGVSSGVSSGVEMVKSYVDETKVTTKNEKDDTKGTFSAEILAKHSNVIGEDKGLVLTLSQYLGGELSIDGVEKSFSAAINMGADYLFESKELLETGPIDVPGIGKIIIKLEDRAFGMGIEVGAEVGYDKKIGASAGIYNKLKHSFAGTVNVRFADSGQEIFNSTAHGVAVLKNDAPDVGSSSLEFENVRVNVAVLESTPVALKMKDFMIRYNEFSEQNPTIGYDL